MTSDHALLLARLGAFYAFAWAASWALLWLQGSYLQRDAFAAISYKGADQPMTDPPYLIGVHTFGDYLQPWTWVQASDPWAGISPPPNYPPLAVLLFEPFGEFPAIVGLGPYLALLFAALLSPFIWATRGCSWWVKSIAISAAVISAPFTVTMDRGNQIGLMVPFLLFFTVGIATNSRGKVFIGLLGAASLKMYPALIAVALLRAASLRIALAVAMSAAAVGAVIFALYPAGLTPNLEAWLTGMVGFSGTGGGVPVVGNYSLTAGLALALGSTSAPAAWILAHPWIPGLLYLLGCVWVVLRSQSPTLVCTSLVLSMTQLVVPVSFRYTSVFALVVLAVLIRDAMADPGTRFLGLPSGPLANVRVLVWCLAMTATLAPLPLTTGNAAVGPAAYVAVLWLVLLILESIRCAVPKAPGRTPNGFSDPLD